MCWVCRVNALHREQAGGADTPSFVSLGKEISLKGLSGEGSVLFCDVIPVHQPMRTGTVTRCHKFYCQTSRQIYCCDLELQCSQVNFECQSEEDSNEAKF